MVTSTGFSVIERAAKRCSARLGKKDTEQEALSKAVETVDELMNLPEEFWEAKDTLSAVRSIKEALEDGPTYTASSYYNKSIQALETAIHKSKDCPDTKITDAKRQDINNLIQNTLTDLSRMRAQISTNINTITDINQLHGTY